MGDENHIRTLGDYYKPSYEGYRNTIELPVRNNVGKNALAFISISLRDKASNWLERLPANPSPHEMILLLVSLLNSIHQEGPQNFAAISLCSNNIQENLFRSMDSFQGLTLKIPSSWHRSPEAHERPVDQGSNVNIMPFSTYMKLTKERPAETDIRLSLASHSHIYPLGIAEDVLVDVASYVYLIDFVILDIKEYENRPFILGTPFLTTAKAVIKFDKGTITLKSRMSKISFHRIHESPCKSEKGIKNHIEPIAPTMTVNRLVLKWGGKDKTSPGKGDGVQPMEE
nr:hypothetical protein [Tanacetum cinerariifolium]